MVKAPRPATTTTTPPSHDVGPRPSLPPLPARGPTTPLAGSAHSAAVSAIADELKERLHLGGGAPRSALRVAGGRIEKRTKKAAAGSMEASFSQYYALFNARRQLDGRLLPVQAAFRASVEASLAGRWLSDGERVRAVEAAKRAELLARGAKIARTLVDTGGDDPRVNKYVKDCCVRTISVLADVVRKLDEKASGGGKPPPETAGASPSRPRVADQQGGR